jgi:hypothetical protein
LRITLKRSGGFGGIRTTASLDISKLAPDKSAEICRLIDGANFFKLPKTIQPQSPQADRFHYELTIEGEGQSHTVFIGEEAASSALKSLIAWVQKNSKA